MRLTLATGFLACVLLALLPLHARAQTSDPLEEAQRLNIQCIKLQDAGKYDEALEPCGRSLAIGEKELGSQHLGIAHSLSNLADVYKAKGEYAKAEPLYQRALLIRDKELGREHLDVTYSLEKLADLYYKMGNYAKAEPLYLRALLIREKVLGTEDLDVATSLNDLAALYYREADYAKAEPLYQRALAIFEKIFGSEDPVFTAKTINGLALTYRAKGDYAKAEQLYQRALAIYEKAFGGKHPDVAISLSNLAELYQQKRDYAKAEPLYQQALAILETLGSQDLELSNVLNNLALLYDDMEEYAKAEPLHRRALEIREKALGSEHPAVALLLNTLARRYYEKGDYTKAEQLSRRALAIREKTLGSEHFDVATTLNNLAFLYVSKSDYPRAVEFLTRGQEILEKNINMILTTGSENQKQLYLDTLWGETQGTVSLHAYSAPANVEAARLALTTILRRKGRALDAMTDQIAALRRRAAPEDFKLLDALAATQSQLANLQLSSDALLSPAERKRRVAELETEIEKLQNEIGRRDAEFRSRTQSVTIDAVRAAIPTDAALIEIFAYKPLTKVTDVNYGKARYVAYVLKPHGDVPQFVDLGETAQVDADLKLWREALLDPSRDDVRLIGRKVDERVMRPIRKLLGTTKRLFISPDGALNLIPFAALVDENNRYLLETYSIDYLTSGRDLLRLKVQSENRGTAFIFADPAYNLTGQPVAACGSDKIERGITLTADAADKREPTYRGIDFTKLCYPPLRGTAEEATRINAILPNATVLTDKSATEGALKALNAPAILHVATHGFFLADQSAATANTRQLMRDDIGNSSSRIPENPLLRSGLILAGANQKSSGAGEDGVLTAAEAAGLNLWGTKLVVLSACETALGDVVNGAGIYGLRRALVLAGSETQVMSLWKVDDAATRDLMVDYYSRLKRGEERAEAMRQAQLAMLRDQAGARTEQTPLDMLRGDRLKQNTNQAPPARVTTGRSHPYYWAAFISSGDWSGMN
jgi:CHAT domain-containing protein